MVKSRLLIPLLPFLLVPLLETACGRSVPLVKTEPTEPSDPSDTTPWTLQTSPSPVSAGPAVDVDAAKQALNGQTSSPDEPPDPAKNDAIAAAVQALGTAQQAYGGIDRIDSSAAASQKAAQISRARDELSRVARQLSNAGLARLAAIFFGLAERDLVYNVRHTKDSFYRDTQTESLTEVAELILRWGYDGVTSAYWVYHSASPRAGDPPEVLALRAPQLLAPLYRCWQSSLNYFFVTTRSDCDGLGQAPNPPNHFALRRTLGYVLKQPVAGSLPLKRYRNLAIPNDQATLSDERSLEGYQRLGVVGFCPND